MGLDEAFDFEVELNIWMLRKKVISERGDSEEEGRGRREEGVDFLKNKLSTLVFDFFCRVLLILSFFFFSLKKKKK